MIESLLPGTVFVFMFVITRALLPTLIASSAVALMAALIRLVQRQPLTQALSGVLGIAVGVTMALVSGRGENYFVWGIITNGISALVLAASMAWRGGLVAWGYGSVTGKEKGWRGQARYEALVRSCQMVTGVWAGIFGARSLLQAPLWWTGNVAALGVAKLVLGLPLFAAGVWVTWRLFRPFVHLSAPDHEATASTGDNERGTGRNPA